MESKEAFLLEEYKGFSEYWKHTENQRHGYFNIYIILFTSLIGLMFIFTRVQNFIEDSDFNSSIDIVLMDEIGLFVFMLLIFFFIIYGTCLIYIEIKLKYEMVSCYWQINLIRKYFIDEHKELVDYLYFETTDGPRTYPSKKGQDTTSLLTIKIIYILNSFLISFLVFFILNTDFLKNKLLESSNCFYNDYYIIFQLIASGFFLWISWTIYSQNVKQNLLLKQKLIDKKFSSQINQII